MKIIIIILFYIFLIILSHINKKENNKNILNLSPINIDYEKNSKNEEEFLKEIKKYLINENK